MQKSNIAAAPAANGQDMSKAAQNAWKVTFNTAKPAAMPTDRMNARAEVVRNALSCSIY